MFHELAVLNMISYLIIGKDELVKSSVLKRISDSFTSFFLLCSAYRKVLILLSCQKLSEKDK